MKILVAEDSDMYRHMLETQLGRWGYEVILAKNGAEAWNVLSSPNAPRLAILDWIMPDIDGIDVCKRVREANIEPYIYIILLTGKDSREDVVLGLDAGSDDYVTKPFDTKELEVRVRAGKRIVDLQAELIAAREQLRIEASHDPLTGLLNRGEITKILLRDCARAQREGTPLAVMMVDVDHFKKVNDTLGHGAGDTVLCELAQRMRNALRPYDALARYGGEEFMLILPACDKTSALAVAERLRLSVSGKPVRTSDKDLHVTCSIGVSLLSPGDAALAEELVETADAALYRAKEGGRNKVISSFQ